MTAREEAEKRLPHEHVGYSVKPSNNCTCDECYVHAQQRDAFEEGALYATDPANEAAVKAIRDALDVVDGNHDFDSGDIPSNETYARAALTALHALMKGDE